MENERDIKNMQGQGQISELAVMETCKFSFKVPLFTITILLNIAIVISGFHTNP